eukprot:scpid3506/ scgid2987/ Serine/threonine-protein kinase atr; Ataxia telangiectasia and Rad3-related protein
MFLARVQLWFVCLGFSCWTVGCVLRLLAESACVRLHPSIIKFLTQLLELAAVKDLCLFQVICCELLEVACDVDQLLLHLLSQDCQFSFPVRLQLFSGELGLSSSIANGQAALDLSPQILELKNVESCNNLRRAVLGLINGVRPSLIALTPQYMTTFTQSLLSQIESGDPKTKTFALQTLSDVMRHGQCCTQLNNPLRALCFGTLEWLFSQCACGMHFAEMEAALAACLLSCPACSDDVEQLQELLVILTSSVVSKAWLSLQTSHLRVAVCHAIFQLLLKLPLDLPSHWCTTHVSLLCDGLLQAYHPVALTKEELSAVSQCLALVIIRQKTVSLSTAGQDICLSTGDSGAFESPAGHDSTAPTPQTSGKVSKTSSRLSLKPRKIEWAGEGRAGALAERSLVGDGKKAAERTSGKSPGMCVKMLSTTLSLILEYLQLQIAETAKSSSADCLHCVRNIWSFLYVIHRVSQHQPVDLLFMDLKTCNATSRWPASLSLIPTETFRMLYDALLHIAVNVLVEDSSLQAKVLPWMVDIMELLVYASGVLKVPSGVVIACADFVCGLLPKTQLSKPLNTWHASRQKRLLVCLPLIQVDSVHLSRVLQMLPSLPGGVLASHVDQVFVGLYHKDVSVRTVAFSCLPAILCQLTNTVALDNALRNLTREAADTELSIIAAKLPCFIQASSKRKQIVRKPLPLWQYPPSPLVDQLEVAMAAVKDTEDSATTTIGDCGILLTFTPLSACKLASVRMAFADSLGTVLPKLELFPDSAVSSLVEVLNRLAEDDEYSIRLSISYQFAALLNRFCHHTAGKLSLACADHHAASRSVLHHLSKLACRKDMATADTAILSIVNIASSCCRESLSSSLATLCDVVLSPSRACLAFSAVSSIASNRNMSASGLFSLAAEAVCECICHMLLAQAATISDTVTFIGQQVSALFQFSSVLKFWQTALPTLLPQLVVKGTGEARRLAIQYVAGRCLNTDYRQQLVFEFKYVFSYLVRKLTGAQLDQTLKFIEGETKTQLFSLLRSESQNLHNQLLLYLSTARQQVWQGLQMLAVQDAKFTCKDVMSEQDMANYLRPKMLGILHFFKSKLQRQDDESMMALQSFTQLIGILCTENVTAMKDKVIAILRLGLGLDKQYIKLTCEAWDMFLHCVDLSALGPNLTEIVVALLPMLSTYPDLVAAMTHFLIVENRKAFGKYLVSLFALPSVPALEDVHRVLCEELSVLDLHTKIRALLEGIQHERVDVRVHAAINLAHLLRDNVSEVRQFVLGSEKVDPIIDEIVAALLIGTKDASTDLLPVLGECFGIVGAVDPGRLRKPKKGLQTCVNNQVLVGDVSFAVDLLSQLTRAFKAAAEPRIQDCCAYALQMTLEHYHCADETNEKGRKICSSFSEDQLEVLRPHLHSRYMFEVKKAKDVGSRPFYSANCGLTFPAWINIWLSHLIMQIKDASAKDVFSCCSVAFKHDVQLAQFLLPVVVRMVILQNDSSANAEIRSELLSILEHVVSDSKDQESAAVKELQRLAVQTVFSVIHHLEHCHRDAMTLLALAVAKSSSSSRAKASPPKKDLTISDFLDGIPATLLSAVAYSYKSYARALMYFEAAARHDSTTIDYSFAQKIYIGLEDADGIAGVFASQKDSALSLLDRALYHESTGDLPSARACFESSTHQESGNLAAHQGYLRCLMNSNMVVHASDRIDGLLNEHPSWSCDLSGMRYEAAWRLSKWSSMQPLTDDLHSEIPSRDGLLCGAFLAAKQSDHKSLLSDLQRCRQEAMSAVALTCHESDAYQHSYPAIVRLHMLEELQQQLCSTIYPGLETFIPCRRDWEHALELVQDSYHLREPILSLRRTLLTMFPRSEMVEKELGRAWLLSAQAARRAGSSVAAYSSLVNVRSTQIPEVCLEKSLLLWQQGHYQQAVLDLQRDISTHWGTDPTDTQSQVAKNNAVQARALLQLGCWMEERSLYGCDTVLKQYEEVVKLHPDWSDGHFHLAKYCDHVQATGSMDSESKDKYLLRAVKSFGLSLLNSNKFIYQAMSRLLTIWLDYRQTDSSALPSRPKKPTASERSEQNRQKKTMTALNQEIRLLLEKLAPYQFFTAFSQLVSRISHPESMVVALLEDVISHVLVNFPQQALWMMVAVYKSSVKERTARCQRIMEKAKSLDDTLAKVLKDFLDLTHKLSEVCNRKCEQNIHSMSIDKDFRSLVRLVSDRNFSPIILPLQSSLTPSLPTSQSELHKSRHDVFPVDAATIQSFCDKVEVLPSMQKPKKIWICCSDGVTYEMLCKPKDDLRKDCRLMEFNALVNKYLYQDPESRRRNLYIRTYAVIPLSEECGLLEWVKHTAGFRHIVTKLYREDPANHMNGKELKALLRLVDIHTPLERRREIFLKELLPRHPSLFYKWFLRTFPDPSAWYAARNSYARTCAVMSMIGYLLGLGDRHGENILFDMSNGDLVHVDFNCLFNLGETFQWPETVPFRLTHNMVHALGVSGVEGAFRRCCEVTMKVVRDQRGPLMSVLNTFVYDPLVEWAAGGAQVEKARTALSRIEARVAGHSSNQGLPLSVEGQVHHQIQAAMDINNLCQLWYGWSAFY